jgi:hypothetical protein
MSHLIVHIFSGDQLLWFFWLHIWILDSTLQWVRCIYRKLAASSTIIHRSDGNVNSGSNGGNIDGPDPEFCNLKLAIARVLHVCGAADIIVEIYRDNDDITQPGYFDGSFVSDDVLYRRLNDRLISHVYILVILSSLILQGWFPGKNRCILIVRRHISCRYNMKKCVVCRIRKYSQPDTRWC